MPSVLQDYEYDIFISYRHKDNRYDAWVTEFVANLRKELESTFKEDISIYFDENLHDGLTDTHDVDASLQDKVKCLVFIPIVSRTYCDPNSFAWKNELLAFHDFATRDKYGLKIKVANGNTCSRILPVRIHELDSEDLELFSRQTGGIMRPVDFVYRTAGVNRPLRAHEDEPRENQNHVFYRDQINKVSNTAKDIITSMKAPKQGAVKSTASDTSTSHGVVTVPTRKFGIAAVLILILCLIGYGVYSFLKITPTVTQPEAEIDRSIAVLPFADMSENKDQEYFSDGLSEELLNLLAKIPALKVISRTSAFSFKGKNEDIRAIGSKLNVAYLLEGSVRKSDDQVRITAQLIKASDGSHIWSETFNRDMNDIFKVQDEIASAVVKELRLKLLGTESKTPRPSKPEVYNLWLQGKFFLNLSTLENTEKAYQLLQNAYAIDSLDARVWSALSMVYYQHSANSNNSDEAKMYQDKSWVAAKKGIALDPVLPDSYEVLANLQISLWDLKAAKSSLEQALHVDPSNAASITTMGILVRDLGRANESIELFKRSIELDPLRPGSFINLAISYAYLENYEEALALINKALAISKRPINYCLLSNFLLLNGEVDKAYEAALKSEDEFWRDYALILALWGQNKKEECNRLLKSFIDKHEQFGAFQIAEIYAWLGDADKSFEWLDKAYVQKDPGLGEIKSSVFLRVMVTDPRYNAMLNKLNMPLD